MGTRKPENELIINGDVSSLSVPVNTLASARQKVYEIKKIDSPGFNCQISAIAHYKHRLK